MMTRKQRLLLKFLCQSKYAELNFLKSEDKKKKRSYDKHAVIVNVSNTIISKEYEYKNVIINAYFRKQQLSVRIEDKNRE